MWPSGDWPNFSYVNLIDRSAVLRVAFVFESCVYDYDH